jgi:hypothetical protein
MVTNGVAAYAIRIVAVTILNLSPSGRWRWISIT